MTTPEGKIQSEIMAYLKARGIFAYRANCGRAGHIRYGTPGQGDITGLLKPNGRRLEVEVKTQTGKQSQAQKEFQEHIEAAGGLYIVARSVDDVIQALGCAGEKG